MDRQIKNRANGLVSTFTQKQWENAQKNPQWKNTFIDVTPPLPKEVQEAKKAAEQEAATGTQTTPARAEQPADKKGDTGKNTNQTTK